MSLQCMGLPLYQRQCILQNWIPMGVREYMTTKLLFKQSDRWIDCNNIGCWFLYMYIFAVQGYHSLVVI